MINTFTNFMKMLPNNIKKVGVAVSGGPDSLSLALIAQKWCQKSGITLQTITVDHMLRKESAIEAQKVSQWMKSLNINHVILPWSHKEIQTKIQERARNARYDIMIDYCKKNNIDLLLTGHQLDDQFETFMMRLSKGSGLRGLCSIPSITKRENIYIGRPFLSLKAEQLKQYLDDIKQEYISDPSNENEDFERVRWRNHLKKLTDFSLDCFASSLERLNLANQLIEEEVEDAKLQTISENDNAIKIKISELFQLHKIVSIELLKDTFLSISKKTYSTAHKSAEKIMEQLENKTFSGLSAGGCIIKKEKNHIIISKDPRIPSV